MTGSRIVDVVSGTVREVGRAMDRLIRAARDLGSPLNHPFMALSFLALPVIPALKITDLGRVDVDRFCHVPLME
jgi:adenine deaminase